VAFFLFIVAPVEGISMDETLKSAISLLETRHVPIDGVGRVGDDQQMGVMVFPSEEDRKRAHEILTETGICLRPIPTPNLP
jgi:hypothetical protein